jgi:hypothetical protein
MLGKRTKSNGMSALLNDPEQQLAQARVMKADVPSSEQVRLRRTSSLVA